MPVPAIFKNVFKIMTRRPSEEAPKQMPHLTAGVSIASGQIQGARPRQEDAAKWCEWQTGCFLMVLTDGLGGYDGAERNRVTADVLHQKLRTLTKGGNPIVSKKHAGSTQARRR